MKNGNRIIINNSGNILIKKGNKMKDVDTDLKKRVAFKTMA